MANVAELVFKAAFGDLVEAKGVLKDLKDKTEDAQKEADKLGDKLSSVSKAGMAFGAAVGSAITAIAGFTAAGINYADSIDEMSERLTVGAEAFSGWAYGAKFAGVSQDELYNAINKLNNAMDDAYNGSQKAAETFERLGINVKTATGEIKTTEEVMGEMADAFEGMEDNASKAAIASEVFGKAAGPGMAQYLSEGREGIEALNEEALRFGLLITNETAKAAGAFNDRMDQMKGVAQGVGTQLAAGLLPTLNNLGEMLLDTANDGTSMNEVIAVGDVLLRGFANAALIAYTAMKTLWQGASTLVEGLWKAFTGDFEGAKKVFAKGWEDIKTTTVGGWETLLKINDEGAAKQAQNAPAVAGKAVKPLTTIKEQTKKEVDAIAEYLKKLDSLIDPLHRYKEELNTIYEAENRPGANKEALAVRRAQLMDIITKELTKETEAEKKLREERERAAETEQKQIDRYTNMAYPLLQYVTQLDELNKLMEKYPEKSHIWMEAMMKVHEAMDKSVGKTKEVKDAQTEMMESLVQAAEGYGQSMSSAFVDWMMGAKTSFSDMVRSMIGEMAKLLMYQAVFKPLTKGIMGKFSFNNGGVFDEGAPRAFNNGLISSPTMFLMANGATGLAGESGTEAIMPLRRDAAGRLGVSGMGGGAVNASININISDVKAQDAPAISKAAQDGVGKAMRGLVQSEVFNQMRLGNALNPMPLQGF